MDSEGASGATRARGPGSDAGGDEDVRGTGTRRSRRRRWFLRRAVAPLALLGAALVLIGVGMSSAAFTSSSVNPTNVVTAGNLRHTNTRANAAVLTAADMAPGDTEQGTLGIRNTGDVNGDFTLRATDLVDTPGPNGGAFSEVLRLRVERTTAPASTLYDGLLRDLPVLSLGTWYPNQLVNFRFTVTFPDAGPAPSPTTGDNAYKRSRTSVTFVWDQTSDTGMASLLRLYSQTTDPDGLTGYAVRAGSAPPELAGQQQDAATRAHLGGITSTTGQWANRVLTIRTPATLPPGVTLVRVTVVRLADTPTGRQPLIAAGFRNVGVNDSASANFTMGANQKRQLNVRVRMNAAWAPLLYQPSVVIQARNNAGGPTYAYTVPMKVYYGTGAGPN